MSSRIIEMVRIIKLFNQTCNYFGQVWPPKWARPALCSLWSWKISRSKSSCLFCRQASPAMAHWESQVLPPPWLLLLRTATVEQVSPWRKVGQCLHLRLYNVCRKLLNLFKFSRVLFLRTLLIATCLSISWHNSYFWTWQAHAQAQSGTFCSFLILIPLMARFLYQTYSLSW